MQQGIVRRKQLESKAADVDSWLRRTESELAETLSLDDDITSITMVMNKYEVWTSSASTVCQNSYLY